MPSAHVLAPARKCHPPGRAAPGRRRTKRARCPARLQGCAASARSQYDVSRAGHAGVGFSAPRKQFNQRRLVSPSSPSRFPVTCAEIPRAGKLAIVAAIDAVADRRPQLHRDRALNSMVNRNAAASAGTAREWPGSRQTSMHFAHAAVIRLGRLRARKICIKLTRKNHDPQFDPAAACACRASRARRVPRVPPRAPARNRRTRGSETRRPPARSVRPSAQDGYA